MGVVTRYGFTLERTDGSDGPPLATVDEVIDAPNARAAVENLYARTSRYTSPGVKVVARWLGDREPLAVGAEAWCMVSRKSGEARETLEGAALVRVVEVTGDDYKVEIVRANGAGLLLGSVIDKRRVELYACAVSEEHAAFGAEVRRFWRPAE